MPRILVSDSLSQDGLDLLDASKKLGVEYDYRPGLGERELAEAIAGFQGLVIRSGSRVTARVIEAANQLRVIGRAGIGVDNVDTLAASRRGIVVMNTPTGNAVTTAEHAIALLFAVARRIGLADATMKEGKWEKKQLEGRELSGKTIGVIGLGNIGRNVADRARGLHMHVLGYDPVLTQDRAEELGVELVSLQELFTRSDAITIHAPKNAQTQNLINDETIATMKRGVLLVNASRGGICNEAAVVRGLESGQIGGAGFDVFAEEPPGITPLVQHPNVVATPHLGASTEEAQTRVAVEICEQIVAFLVYGSVTNAVNVPSVPREQAAALGPYLVLARRLGRFLGAVESLIPKTVTVEFGGEAADVLAKPVINAAISGLLGRLLGDEVNEVSAPVVAKDRGIEVKELKTNQKSAFASLLRITAMGADGRQATVAGTLGSDKGPRLLAWGDFEMDAKLEGSMLVLKNQDRPGVIGAIGTILADNGINVSNLQVAPDVRLGRAVQVWGLSAPLGEGVTILVRASKDVEGAFSVDLT